MAWQISVHTHERLDSERFNNLGDVLKLDVFTQGVLLQMFEKWLRILLMNVYPVFHILICLTGQLWLGDDGVEHHFALHGQKPCVYGGSVLLSLKQLHVVSGSVLQDGSRITASNRQDGAMGELGHPSVLEYISLAWFPLKLRNQLGKGPSCTIH